MAKSLRELIDLDGRVALVTGGGGHIGAELGNALAELGASVVVLDVASESCEKIAKELHACYGIHSMPLVVDLTEEEQIRAVPNVIAKEFGRLDILVNCAALTGGPDLEGWTVPFEQQSSASWRLGLEVNLTAAFILVQSCSELLQVSGRGSVINISSIHGIVAPDLTLYEGTPMGSAAAYGVSKAGLLQMTRWLAAMLAPRVRANAITPVGVWRNQPDDFHKRYTGRVPLGRMAREEDFKGALAYLASDLSSYVTGQNLVVDGGWTVW
jgi:NAD(P)-dependent dehydrogenase (short-subunit alcohol dehydrogenase family)